MKLLNLLVITFFLFISCPAVIRERGDLVLSLPTSFEEASTLFLADPVLNERVFSFNRVSAVQRGGATYWFEQEPKESEFTSISTIFRKSSGHGGGGFGVFFSQRGGSCDTFSAPAVFINILGEYCAGLIHDGCFEYVIPWTGCENLVKGYGQNNTIGIMEGNRPGQYRIFLNGYSVNEWEDPSEISHEGGGYGYLAVITPLENFPSVPVIIRFKKN